MEVLKYFEEKSRMCKTICKGAENSCSSDCPLFRTNLPINVNEYSYSCCTIIAEFPEVAVEVVEKWSKENPEKSYKEVLLERFPNAKLNEKQFPLTCMIELFGIDKCPTLRCSDCWNLVYKGE